MASFSSTYPSQRPVFTLDAANAGRLDSRMTFTRSDTPPTYAAPSAVHYWSNEKHLSSENLITNSEDFSAWTASNTTPTANAVAAPDGTTTADTITGTGTGSLQKSVQSNTISASYPVVSVYVKAGSHNYIQIQSDWSGSHYANFDVTSGAGAVGSLGGNTTATIQAVGSTGWYRCVCRYNAASMSPIIIIRLVDSASAAYGAATTTTGTVHLWGAMATGLGDLTNIVAYQPSTTSIHRQYAPTLKSVATAGQPRFEYDPSSDGQSMGILIEGQFQQLAQYTEDLSNAYWTKANTTVESNAAVAPDGTLTADLVVETTATGVGHHVRTDNVTGISSSTTYTATVYAKAAGLGFCRLYTNIGAANTGAVFNLSDGTHNVTDGSGTFSSSSVGNGWYRLQMTFTTSNTNNGAVYFHTATDSSTVIYTGNGYGSVILWGANLTQSSHSYSYLKAEGAATTKAAESLSVDAADIGYTGGPVSMQADFKVNSVLGSTRRIASIENTRGLIRPYISGGGDVKTFGDTDGATVIDTSIQTDITANTDYSMALRWDTNDYRGALNGTLGNADTSCPLPDFDGASFYVGGQSSSGYELNGHIKRVALYNEALSDTNLQALTS